MVPVGPIPPQVSALWKGLARQRAATTEWVTSDERSHASRSDTVVSVLLASGWIIIAMDLFVIFRRPKCHIEYST